ncbi:MAG: hypothetical protein A2Z83_03050 [Omnitrophica bacterium GWA2_52_8]|nr:MAG: hypothetical protein A2Z83_03050 [Omnitrophica bacterium GWA2_52_8]
MPAFYYTGRVLQGTGLVAMPSAIWAGQIYHNEAAAITVFAGSLVVFYLGYVLVRIAQKR